jgi:beta-lactamase regulating signal transducer with metallopeptidase domain
MAMSVMHAMLGNAAVAAVLALLAVGVRYVCRSPAVRHFAWLLVLFKLVTPPLFIVPLRVLPASWAEAAAEPAPLDNAIFCSPSAAPGTQHAPSKGVVGAPGGQIDWARWAANSAIAVWIAGAAVWLAWQARRIVRFRRRMARAEDAGPDVAAAARRIAAALGIANPPAVKAANGVASPMLWGWGRNTVVLFPRELLARLAPEARDTLLAHELAHFLRRDHWVRVLEFAATALYWWHPAVWLARAGVEAAEEACCDAWVVGGLGASPRRYAEALLATVDYVAELHRPCLPPGACAANRGAQLLYRRLVGIIDAKRPSRLQENRVVRAAALALLLVQPVLRAAAPESSEPSPDPVITKHTRPKLWSGTETTPQPGPKLKSREPRSWATAVAPGGGITVLARDKEVVLRRTDGTETALIPGRPLALAFAPGGKRLATVGPGCLVRTWDDQGCLLAKGNLSAAGRALTYTPDGSQLLVLDAAGNISVRHPDTLAQLSSWSVAGPANSIACAPDGRTVAVACGSWLAETGWVECWSISERQKLAYYEMSAPVGATRFSPDGRTLIIGAWNGLLSWRALPDGKTIAERQLSKDLVASAAFSPDAGTLPLEPPPEPEPTPMIVPFTISNLSESVSRVPKR